MSQMGGVLRLEMKKTSFKRGWWITAWRSHPCSVADALADRDQQSLRPHSIGEDSIVFAALYHFYFLRCEIFFRLMGIFSNLFRGEMLEKTLHYYYLTPLRREVLVAGKYLAGLASALVLFVSRRRSRSSDRPPLRPRPGPTYLLHGPA